MWVIEMDCCWSTARSRNTLILVVALEVKLAAGYLNVKNRGNEGKHKCSE